jgi:hypothetical protein
MLCCGDCGEEIPIQSALLTQDPHANTVGFCSPFCRDGWYTTTFGTSTPSSTGIAASTGSSARYFAAATCDPNREGVKAPGAGLDDVWLDPLHKLHAG